MIDSQNKTEMKKLIRIRIWLYDYNGARSQRTEVRYFESVEEAEKISWKYEIAQ